MAKILLIDDAAVTRLVLKNILLEFGHEIEEAASGNEGIQKFKKCNPDLIILDIIMAEMDGIATLKIIRNIDPKTKVIMCTTLGQKKLVIQAFQEGAVNYIIKPFGKEKIMEVVQKVIG